MPKPLILMLFLTPSLLLGCGQEETYPISGEECTQSDPVKDLRPLDCVPPGTL